MVLHFVPSIINATSSLSNFINYSVALPDKFDWGVSSYAEESVSLISVNNGKQAPFITGGGIDNSTSQSGVTDRFQLAPCGATGCGKELIICMKCPLGCNGYMSFSMGPNACPGYSYITPVWKKNIKDNSNPFPLLAGLLYAQASPFVTSTDVQKLITAYFNSIDMSQYLRENDTGEFELRIFLDLSTGGKLSGTESEF